MTGQKFQEKTGGRGVKTAGWKSGRFRTTIEKIEPTGYVSDPRNELVSLRGEQVTAGKSKTRRRTIFSSVDTLPQAPDLAPPPPQTETTRPERPIRAGSRSRERIQNLLAQPEMLTSDEIGERMDLSREAVNQRRREGRLLALQGAKRGYKYPEWQLDAESGAPLDGLDRLIKACGYDHWKAHRILVQRHGEVDGMTGLDALRTGRIQDLREVVTNMEAGVFA